MTIKELIENKSTLDYKQICISLIQAFRVDDKVNWESVLPAQQQQEYFGGETLRLIAEHPILSKQKDIRPIALKRGSISQMLFFYVCLNDSTLPKKQIQDVTKKFISGGDANRYIIWFFGNKESTQLKVVLSAKEGKKIVLKTLPFGVEQPYYKTYTFILNEVAQKVSGLFVEPTDLWKALWTAFDISIINRNFYDEIKGAFTGLLKQLNKKGTPFANEEDKVQFAIRLIGRIIFCWFLKRKEVLHDAAISSEAVKAHPQKNYYHDLLEPLFFDVLNTPDKERKGGLPKIIAHYPFLNGGLFEAQETDYKQHLLLNIDNDWFLSLFSKTLERYNFTVDENSSSNAEIAIDPEMLGRIFENLLAEQNPETGDSARKATGSFYTPREIVDYMVEQSVSEFLKTALALDEKLNVEIEDFVHTQILPDALAKQEERISEELSKIKVLDPACGSGAFPIGILQKIVALKQQLHPKAKNYKLKLGTIQNSIYGVDIQPMAVELSRLRCWLSLVVDEDPRDIKALPNLDFKFVCADSLMEVGKIKQINIGNSAEKIEELKGLRTEFFIASGKRKIELEKKFKQIQTSLNNNFLEWDGKSKLVENLASWKPFDNHKTNWFDAFWMFGLNDGFDVVIGNPPYKILTKNNTQEKQLHHYINDYKSIKKSNSKNLYTLFIESSISLLSKFGTLSFIVPEGLFVTRSYKDCVEVMNNTGSVTKIATFTSFVFENAVTGNLIFLYSKNKKVETQKLHFDENYNIEKLVEVDNLPIQKIQSLNTVELKNVATLFKGMVVSDRNEVVGEDSSYGENIFLLGKSIAKWEIIKEFYTDYNKLTIIGGTKLKAKHDTVPRILIRRTGDVMCCSYITEPALTESTLYSCWSITSEVDNKYLLAVLNSSLFTYFIQRMMITNKQAFPQILMTDLEELPILKINQEKQKPFINLVSLILQLSKSKSDVKVNQPISNNLIVKAFEEIIDGMVLEIYFEEEMKSKKVNIIELVEKELEKAKSKETTESIYNFYKSVSHPDSEIRNRILSFAIVSPDILKPILQGQ